MAISPKTGPNRNVPTELARHLFLKSGAAQYGFTESTFADVLEAIAQRLSVQATAAGAEFGVTEVLPGLRLEEVALAHGCAAGSDKAWEVFLTRYRERLFDTARKIAHDETAARDLADSIYADLWGTETKDGLRVSRLSSYTGRGSLEGWLRTVIAQEWVNRFRKAKRLVSLEEQEEAGRQFVAREPVSAPAPAILEEATDAALSELDAEDRYLLASYFLDQHTLAEIGRTLGMHESTVSRRLDRAAKKLRSDILLRLVRSGMSRAQAEEAMDIDVRELNLDLRARLAVQAPKEAMRDPEP
jgi:RNA polymerase sigma-70 factor (ECF subfamily)